MLIGVLHLELGLLDASLRAWYAFGFLKKLVLFVGKGVFGGRPLARLPLPDILTQFFHFRDPRERFLRWFHFCVMTGHGVWHI